MEVKIHPFPETTARSRIYSSLLLRPLQQPKFPVMTKCLPARRYWWKANFTLVENPVSDLDFPHIVADPKDRQTLESRETHLFNPIISNEIYNSYVIVGFKRWFSHQRWKETWVVCKYIWNQKAAPGSHWTALILNRWRIYAAKFRTTNVVNFQHFEHDP